MFTQGRIPMQGRGDGQGDFFLGGVYMKDSAGMNWLRVTVVTIIITPILGDVILILETLVGVTLIVHILVEITELMDTATHREDRRQRQHFNRDFYDC